MQQPKTQYSSNQPTIAKQRFAQDDILASQDSVTSDQMNDIFAKPTFSKSTTAAPASTKPSERPQSTISSKAKNDPSVSSLYGKESPKREVSSRRDRFSSTAPLQQGSRADEPSTKMKYKDAEPSVNTYKLFQVLGVNV